MCVGKGRMAEMSPNAVILPKGISQPTHQALHLPGEEVSKGAESSWSYSEFPALEGNKRNGQDRVLINLLVYHLRLNSNGPL